MEEQRVINLLDKAMLDNSWFDANFNGLFKHYPDKFIAVCDRKVIDADDKIQVLIEKVKKKGLDPSEVAVKFVSKMKMVL
ncbi:MAG: DUF5678 domain-containing protein [Candidatus Woesearchaeota archaeon]